MLRAELAARLATLVTSVADSRPARRRPPRPPTASDPAATTTTLPPTGSRLASNQLREFLSDLDDAGFVKLSDQPDDADTADLAALRLVVMSGAGAKLDNALFVYPFLQRMVGGAEPSTLAVEATKQGSEVERGSFVGAIRNDGSLERARQHRRRRRVVRGPGGGGDGAAGPGDRGASATTAWARAPPTCCPPRPRRAAP